MSHFAVVVIGKDVDKQLAPYHEFECTGMDDEFVQDLDRTEYFRARYDKDVEKCLVKGDEILNEYICRSEGRFLKPLTTEQGEMVKGLVPFYNPGDVPPGVINFKGEFFQFRPEDYGYERATIPVAKHKTFLQYLIEYEGFDAGQILNPDQPLNNKCKYKYVRLDTNGEVTTVVTRTNPNARWDYYGIGGRWSGFFPTSEGNVDSCKWGDVDWEKARGARRQTAANTFDAWKAIYELHGKAKSLEEMAQEMFGKPSSELERTEYAGIRESWLQQEAVKHSTSLGDPVQEFGYDRDAYIERCEQKTLVPIAVVVAGKWYERGRMGWFGSLHDKMSDEDWNKQVHDLYSSLDGETQVTIVDCHI